MKKFLVALAIVGLTATSSAKADEALLSQISDFEFSAQHELEVMVVGKNVDVSEINAKVRFFSSKLEALTAEEQQIGLNILADVSQACALVETRA